MTSIELLAAAERHLVKVVRRYGPGSYQAQCAERAMMAVSGLVAPPMHRSSPVANP